MRTLRELAERRGVTVSELVRTALREASRREPGGQLESKVEAIRAAAAYDFPTADIDQMLDQIESGYAGTPAP